MLILKKLWARLVYKKITGVDLNVLRELEGPHGGRTWFAGTERSCRLNNTIIANGYSMSMITYQVEGKGVRGGKARN